MIPIGVNLVSYRIAFGCQPRVEILTAILNTLGCQISILPIDSTIIGLEIVPEDSPIAPTESTQQDFELNAGN